MRIQSLCLLLLAPCLRPACAQSTVPTFQHTIAQGSYTLVGRDPAQGGTTTIPTVLVPITLSFEARKTAGKPFIMDAAPDVPRLLRSPVFSKFDFPSGGATQYADALLRTTFPKAEGWHTLLGKPEVMSLKINVPLGYGYILTSKKTGDSFAVADVEFLQKELFKQLPKQPGKLVIAVTHNTTYYADGDATVCCSWGTHGIDSATENSFVLASYLHAAPAVVEDRDVQPLAEPSKPCPARGGRAGAGGGGASAPPQPTVAAIPATGSPNGHQLIGYWAGYGAAGSTIPLREVSPQWDVIIVAFSTPDKNAPEGTMQFHTPAGLDTEQFKADIAYLKSQGRKVMISLRGGGQHFTLADPKRVPNFVSSVTRIVAEYGFDGIDIDFQSPSLSIDPGDTDFKHPTTPSIVNLISALRPLHDHFGARFMISLLPDVMH